MSEINNCLDCALTECPFHKSNYENESYWECPDFAKQYAEKLEKRNKSDSSKRIEEKS
jgi:transposase-like protein